jgi:hypothetical protein
VIKKRKRVHSGGESVEPVCPRHQRLDGPFASLMEMTMSKTNDTVRELRDDELEKVNGGYIFTDVMVESIVAPRDFNSGHTVGFSLGATQTGY